jgi:superfamily II DNA/RNA helicase
MPAENSAVRQPTFASLGVPASLVAVLDDDGITTPFPIQEATLPDALAGRDILGRAQTGSGKTLGFALPLVARLAGGRTMAGRPRGLVLVPTRELATQVNEVLKPLAKAMRLWVTTIYGGVSQGPQVNALQRRTDIIVATPGRLADLIGQGHCDLSDVEITVIDEADQMADLGFLPIVRRLLEATPSDGQRLLFSATLDSAIDVLARRFLTDPAHHSVDENSSPAEIDHHVITVDPGNRVEVIAALTGGDKRSLVFTRTKHGAERLARQLTTAGIPAAELHGNLRQGARSRNLAAFGSGAVRVMVATDIAARGIHVDGIDLVIHADPPAEHKAYVHRSGRTARGGADGVVVTMQTAAQAREVRALMRKAGVTPQVAEADPDSAVVREIAGPPAPRVTLLSRAADLVQPEDRLSESSAARQPGAGRPGRGKPRQRPFRADGAGRPSRVRHGSADRPPRQSGDEPRYGQRDRAEQGPGDRGDRPVRRFDDRGERPARRFDDRGERPGQRFDDRGERPARRFDDRGERPGQRFDDRGERPARRFDDRGGRPARQFDDRGERPARRFDGSGDRPARRFDGSGDRPARQFDDRGRSDDSGQRGRSGGHGRGEWAPAGRSARGTGGRSWRGNGAGPESGSRRGGAGVRSGYPGQRSAGGNRRNSGQGRHF